jgi:hypothetical protein
MCVLCAASRAADVLSRPWRSCSRLAARHEPPPPGLGGTSRSHARSAPSRAPPIPPPGRAPGTRRHPLRSDGHPLVDRHIDLDAWLPTLQSRDFTLGTHHADRRVGQGRDIDQGRSLGLRVNAGQDRIDERPSASARRECCERAARSAALGLRIGFRLGNPHDRRRFCMGCALRFA